ncbi:hypothetical protein [Streptomyces sp. Cmuel-A718b]|uniref:hypothetical protein n=1 Tax=Streptomyces sp. Cmuel-A718b TaxID=697328 RepID=UPI00081F55C7|nr:hypothetical protein [Streptomyces sp. Cmuel-A718b]SCF57288.1 hypothetical protein GA0115280_100373 [Streptomyces sp. Cmuel-A718b]
MPRQQKHPAVDAALGRRRTRLGTAWIVGLLALPFAGLAVSTVVGLHPGVLLVVTGLAALVGFVLISEMPTGRNRGQTSGSLLTARTATGLRTVDLAQIESVRLLTSFSRGGVSDRIVLVRDGNGVLLGLREQTDVRRVRRALDQRARNGVPPRVSGAAAAYLGMTPDGTARHTVLSWLATVLGICCYLSAVAVLARAV